MALEAEPPLPRNRGSTDKRRIADERANLEKKLQTVHSCCSSSELLLFAGSAREAKRAGGIRGGCTSVNILGASSEPCSEIGGGFQRFRRRWYPRRTRAARLQQQDDFVGSRRVQAEPRALQGLRRGWLRVPAPGVRRRPRCPPASPGRDGAPAARPGRRAKKPPHPSAETGRPERRGFYQQASPDKNKCVGQRAACRVTGRQRALQS